jgi:RNA polymerase primary sigma factor
VRRQFETREGRAPTLDEIAADTGLAKSKVVRIQALEQGPIASLDAPVPGTDQRTVVDLLETDEDYEPDARIAAEELEDGLEVALQDLRPMEADILRSRYGLGGAKKQTLREIGERYALSRERIRQLQERALERLRDRFRDLELL